MALAGHVVGRSQALIALWALLRLRDQHPQATLDVLRRFLLSQYLTLLDRNLCVVTEDRVRIRHG